MDTRLAAGTLVIEPAAYRASLGGIPLRLTPSQFELLAFLIRHDGRVVTRPELAQAGGLDHERSVDVVLSSLRRVLGGTFVRNVRGRGWILEHGPLVA